MKEIEEGVLSIRIRKTVEGRGIPPNRKEKNIQTRFLQQKKGRPHWAFEEKEGMVRDEYQKRKRAFRSKKKEKKERQR